MEFKMKIKLSILIVLFCVPLSFGQTFSPEWQKVPVTFNGHDFEAIFDVLLSARDFFKKDEFETTAKFTERISNPANIKLGNNLTAADTLIFVYRPSPEKFHGLGDLTSKYDADKGILNAKISTLPVTTVMDAETNNPKLIQLPATSVKAQFLKNEGEYIGSNSFGVKTTISKVRGKEFSLAIANIKDYTEYDKEDVFPSLAIPLALSSVQAKTVKNNLAVAFITKLAAPYRTISKTEVKPTIDKPSDILSYHYYLIGNISEIWIFDGASGVIYAKIKPKK